MVNGSLNECIRRYFFPVSSQRSKKKKTPDLRLLTYRFSYSWLASTWHGGHVGGQYIKNSFPRIFMRVEMFLFTNMATMMSLQTSDSRNVSLGITYEEWCTWCTHTIHWIKEIFLALEKETVHCWLHDLQYSSHLLKNLSRYDPLRIPLCWFLHRTHFQTYANLNFGEGEK